MFCTEPEGGENECANDSDDRTGTIGFTTGYYGIGFTGYEDGVKCISISASFGGTGLVVVGGDASLY